MLIHLICYDCIGELICINGVIELSRLERFAKEEKRAFKQTTLRVPVDDYEEFMEICERLNLSFNEAVNKLIELEIESERRKKAKDER